VEKAASPAPFISVFTASEVRKQHILQNDETAPSLMAVGATCEICGHLAVTNQPRLRCEVHKA
jgi:hypothetical protein